jgi:hypothetical protein
MDPIAMRVTEMGASEGCPVIGQIKVASPLWDNITSPETELTSCWCSSSRPLEEPMNEAKQMTTASRWCSFTHGWWIFRRRANRQQASIA